MRILITGNKGQLGTSIEKLMQEKSFTDVSFVDLPDFDLTNETCVKDCIFSFKPELIINCSAYTAVDKAEEERDMAEKVNSIGVKYIGKYSSQINAKVIHISTDYVFEGKGKDPTPSPSPQGRGEEVLSLICEEHQATSLAMESSLPLPCGEGTGVGSIALFPDDNTNPQSIYGKTKLDGEINLITENKNSIIIRTSWLYSPFGNNFVKTMLKLGRQKEFINVVYDQIGTPTYAIDLAAVIVTIAEKTELDKSFFVSGIYHYSNEGVCSWYDFAVMIFKTANIPCRVNPILTKDYPTAAKRPAFSVLDKSKIKKQFGIEIPHWIESLEKCLEKLETPIN